MEQSFVFCTNAPIISHLLFAVDCFLFFRANEGEAMAMKDILATCKGALSQSINFQKSKILCQKFYL